jgi:FMN phosphatase YigB (HAD superfamily)
MRSNDRPVLTSFGISLPISFLAASLVICYAGLTMVKAIFFDFYSVWAPDKIQAILDEAKAVGAPETMAMTGLVDRYYHGELNLARLAYSLKFKLGSSNSEEASLALHGSDISPDLVNFMRALHGHFVKLGILGNLGFMELSLLYQLNSSAQPLFEAIVSPLSLSSPQSLLSQEVFNQASQTIGEVPGACVAVSGHDNYLAFASSFGMQTIKFTDLAQLEISLANLLAKDIPSSIDSSQ